jgi:hypothetical protein
MAEEEKGDASNQVSKGVGKAVDMIIEDASSDEDELCPSCEDMDWLRLIADYKNGVCYVIYCGKCGKSIEKRWNTKS